MENVTITLKTKKVGNSLAVFLPAQIKDELELVPDDEIIAHIHKKKKKSKKEMLSLFGALKGKHITWKCEEDRHDEHRD